MASWRTLVTADSALTKLRLPIIQSMASWRTSPVILYMVGVLPVFIGFPFFMVSENSENRKILRFFEVLPSVEVNHHKQSLKIISP